MNDLYSILLVEFPFDRWSFTIVKGDKRIYNSSAFWPTPEETWSEAILEFHRLKVKLKVN